MKKTASLALCAALVLGTGPALATEFNYSSWTPPPAPNNRLGTVPMFERIQEQTAGTEDEITFNNFMGAQLFNSGTTLAGIRDGAVDGGILVPAYNSAELKTHVTLGEMQALIPDGFAGAAAGTETLLLNCPDCLAEYAEQNVYPMGVYASTPYYLMCNSEISSFEELQGKRSAEGNPMFNRWAAKLGMSRQSLAPPEFQQALQRGTVDCVFAAKDWLVAYSLADVVKTIVEDVPHGAFAAVVMMAMNTDTWDGMTEVQREVFRREVPQALMDVTNGYYVDEERGMAAANENGVMLVNFGEEYARLWDEFQQEERAAIIEAANARGATSGESIVDRKIELMAEWQAIVEELNYDKDALAERLYERVFSQLPF
jgi:TRAP-type C4-dicarboxylate transport system substrate-binding protein